jgi:hypothetical protein
MELVKAIITGKAPKELYWVFAAGVVAGALLF